MSKYCLFLIVFLLTNVAKAQDDEYSIRSQSSELKKPGMVVGTITINSSGKRNFDYRLVFREQDQYLGKKTVIMIRPTYLKKKKFQPDYWDGNKAVYVFVWKRSEKNYWFSDVDLLYFGSKTRLQIDFPFSIKQDSVTYFGNIEINDGDGSVTRNDLFERDMYIIYSKYPNSSWYKYKNGNIITEAKRP